jgi:hypothetical protein
MSWVQVSSDSIALRQSFGTYGIAKYPIRKQFALIHYSDAITPVAYFRTEADALNFAAAFRLNVTDHREGA